VSAEGADVCLAYDCERVDVLLLVDLTPSEATAPLYTQPQPSMDVYFNRSVLQTATMTARIIRQLSPSITT